MVFYFIIHVFLGVLLNSSGLLVMRARSDNIDIRFSVPGWVHAKSGIYLQIFSLGACVAAIITSLVNSELIWTGVTLAEMALGAMLAGLLPMKYQAIIVATSPISIIAIFGDLWKFWYI